MLAISWQRQALQLVQYERKFMIHHHFSSGMYAKETRIPAGHILVQHAHKHDHLSILASGSVEMVVDGVKSVVHAPACLTIAAGKHHGVKSLTDVVWYCVHATDCTNENEVDEVLIVPSNVEEMQELALSLKE
jgi:mannose-6-phosphate isomerase-like protein (cupin superfamily)